MTLHSTSGRKSTMASGVGLDRLSSRVCAATANIQLTSEPLKAIKPHLSPRGTPLGKSAPRTQG